VKMQLHMKYARITNPFFTAFHQQFKCFNHECHMAIAHSVFKQTVLNVSAQQCSNTRSKSVAKWYNCLVSELVKQIILYCRQNGLFSWHYVGQLWRVSLVVFQHSTSHMIIIMFMIIYWHIHMVHFLLFLHQNCSLVTSSLTKLYF